ncbi:hypothetical protein DYU11_27775 [Fibrisoma montanum]|uniref:Lipoprotein n=1 Tax=Fibrisoma montanum TaxID=2305895 RepID=A0A418LZP0_9BACT|nr:hypothetical protein [Fibrisoma montanum]RIV18763.1 hypothetical protein DYU11_27775 [Fibrisoma montanum]
MQRRQIHQGLFIIGLALSLTACFNEPDFPNSPEIEFKGIDPPFFIPGGTGIGQAPRDSLIVTIGFKDGDGDLGDNIPLDSATQNRYLRNGGWGNYRIRTFKVVRGQEEEVQLTENNFLVFPRLTREGQKGPIEGTLEFRQIYFYTPFSRKYPIKFRIQIRDRALNVSNEIETDTVSVPLLEQ